MLHSSDKALVSQHERGTTGSTSFSKEQLCQTTFTRGNFSKSRKKCIKISDTQIAFLRRFPNPYAGLSGQGANIHTHNVTNVQWTLMDELEVPADLVPGDYVLSFR